MTGVQAYDGKNGWQIDPFQGKKTPEAMSEDDLRAIKESADFDDWAAVGPIVNYKEKGNQVELVGKDDVEGTPTYKLKVTLKSGDVRYIYLDAENYVAIKQESKRTIRGAEREFETSIGDYKEEGGIMVAHSVESKPKGAPQGAKVTIEKVEINPDIPDSYFTMPAGTAPAPVPEKPTATTEKKQPAATEKKSDSTKKTETKKEDKPKQ
jgi:outer membrane lipoprotein-sorting protein